MYVEIRPHYSKTRGLSRVLNLRTSSAQVRRPTSHEPTSPEHGRKHNRHRAGGVYQQYTVGPPLLPRNLRFFPPAGGSLAAQRALPTQCIEFKTIRLSPHDSPLAPRARIHEREPDRSRRCAVVARILEARSGGPRRWELETGTKLVLDSGCVPVSAPRIDQGKLANRKALANSGLRKAPKIRRRISYSIGSLY